MWTLSRCPSLWRRRVVETPSKSSISSSWICDRFRTRDCIYRSVGCTCLQSGRSVAKSPVYWKRREERELSMRVWVLCSGNEESNLRVVWDGSSILVPKLRQLFTDGVGGIWHVHSAERAYRSRTQELQFAGLVCDRRLRCIIITAFLSSSSNQCDSLSSSYSSSTEQTWVGGLLEMFGADPDVARAAWRSFSLPRLLLSAPINFISFFDIFAEPLSSFLLVPAQGSQEAMKEWLTDWLSNNLLTPSSNSTTTFFFFPPFSRLVLETTQFEME